MNKKKILLTGASGMVGKNLLEHSEIDRFNVLTPNRKTLDLLNYESVINYIKKNQPELIIHAAGKVGGIQANIREPINFFISNLDIGRNLILASYQLGIKKIFNLGSSCMYPRNSSGIFTEDMILKGELESTNEGYALAKIATAKFCDYIRREDSSFEYKTIIPCNLYGKYDKFHPSDSHLIPAIIHKIHQAKINKETVEIWGDGNVRREFMYAADLADFLIKAIEDFDSIPEYINVGLGEDYTISEYYKIVANVLEFHGQFSYSPDKPNGMKRKLLNVQEQKKLGWSPKTTIEAGIKKSYEYYLKEYLK